MGGLNNLLFKKPERGLSKCNKEGWTINPYKFYCGKCLVFEKTTKIAEELLSMQDPPDAFFRVSDHQSLPYSKLQICLALRYPETWDFRIC